jgi:hypothetical protein
MFTEAQVRLFAVNAKACPCRGGRWHDGLTQCKATQEACLPEQCPQMYWLAVTGLLAKAVIPMQILNSPGSEPRVRRGLPT